MSLTARITALAQAVGADIKTALAHIGTRGSAHAAATTSENGFLTAADKQKLDSMSAGASGDANAAIAAHVAADDPHGPDYVYAPDGYAVLINGSDLNALYRTGLFRGYGLVHAPLDNGGWWHVLIASGDANWVKQTATAFGLGNTQGDTYERVCSSGSWTSWAKVYKGADVYPVAASLGSGASINGKVFSGLENIRVAESIHSVRDCTLGTLIETSIDYTGFSGDPFLLRITGNSYGRSTPVDISVQGYIYDYSLLCYGGISTGSVISGLVALLHNGHLCFWFPYQGYWEGYDVSVIIAYPDQNVNKVISIQNAAMPADAERVVELSSRIRQAITRGEAIDGAAIGQTTPAAGAFTTLTASGLSVAGAGTFGGAVSAAGLSLGGNTLALAESGVRSWQLQATGGNAQLSSGDGVGSFSVQAGIKCSGSLLAGDGSDYGWHRLRKSAGNMQPIVVVDNGTYGSVMIRETTEDISGQADCVLDVARNPGTGRSIRAMGTVGTSGADYAEYEFKSPLWYDWSFVKGDIVGFDVNGLLTPKYSEAVRFGVKSSNPSFVGGDDWVAVFGVGKCPFRPVYQAPDYPDYGSDDSCINRDASVDLLIHQQYEEAVSAATADHKSALISYEREMAAYQARLDEARSWVDRVAYSGKVPVNFQDARPGDYLIAVPTKNDTITCRAARNLTLDDYLRCVGRVNKLLPDGRAEIAVITH